MIGLQRGVNYAPPGQYRHKWGPKADIFDEELRKKTLEPPPDHEQMELQQFEAEYTGPNLSKKRKTVDAGSLFYIGKKRIKQAWQQRKWRVDDQFAKDFQVWLLGRDPDNLYHPAYVKTREKQHGIERKKGERFFGKDIDEWLGSFIDRKADFMKKLTYLKMGPNKAFKWNLDHYWLFYKYIMRGLPFPSDYVLSEFDAMFPDTQGERKPEDAWRSLRWAAPPADAWDKPKMADDMEAERVLLIGTRERLAFDDWPDNPMYKELYRPLVEVDDLEEAEFLKNWGINVDVPADNQPDQGDDDLSAAPRPGSSDPPPSPGKGPDDDNDNPPPPPAGGASGSGVPRPEGPSPAPPDVPPSSPPPERPRSDPVDARAERAKDALSRYKAEARRIREAMLPRIQDGMSREVRALFPGEWGVKNVVVQGFSDEIKLHMANAQMELLIAMTDTKPGQQPNSNMIGNINRMWRDMSKKMTLEFSRMQDSIVKMTKDAASKYHDDTETALNQLTKQQMWSTMPEEERQQQADAVQEDLAERAQHALLSSVAKMYTEFYKAEMKEKMKQTSKYITSITRKFVNDSQMLGSERVQAMKDIYAEMLQAESTLDEIQADIQSNVYADVSEETRSLFVAGHFLRDEFNRNATLTFEQAYEYDRMVREEMAKAQASNDSPGAASTHMATAIGLAGKLFSYISSYTQQSEAAVNKAAENSHKAQAAVSSLAQPTAPAPAEEAHVIDINEDAAQEEPAKEQPKQEDKGKQAAPEPEPEAEQSTPAPVEPAKPPPPFMPHLKEVKDPEPKVVHHLKDVGEKGPSKFKQSIPVTVKKPDTSNPHLGPTSFQAPERTTRSGKVPVKPKSQK